MSTVVSASSDDVAAPELIGGVPQGDSLTDARSNEVALTVSERVATPDGTAATATVEIGAVPSSVESPSGERIVSDPEVAQALAASAYEAALPSPASSAAPQDAEVPAQAGQPAPVDSVAHTQSSDTSQSVADHVSADSIPEPEGTEQPPSVEALPEASQAHSGPALAGEPAEAVSLLASTTPAEAQRPAEPIIVADAVGHSTAQSAATETLAGTEPSETAPANSELTSDSSSPATQEPVAVSPSAETTLTATVDAPTAVTPSDAPDGFSEAAAATTETEPTPSIESVPAAMPSTGERAALPFGEVTQPFGLKLDLAAIASESDPTAEDASTGKHADTPTQDTPAPRKARGFVVAEHGELLTTPVAPAASLDATELAVHGGTPAPFVETPEFTTPPVAPTPRAPIELDDLSGASDEPMQLASTWEFVGWQGGDDAGPIGHVPETTWADRGVDLDGPAISPAATEVPLASAWDFIQQPWQPTAAEPSEVITTLLSAAASAATEVPVGGPSVTAEHVLSALDVVSTQGTLGRVVLAYCAGRFQRAFLLGESLGLARVGHAWGPGSESAAVAGLKVDLEAPSLLHTAMTSMGASVFDAPACPQDEAIFAALGGEGASHLAVIAIRSRGQAVAFIVADHGAEPIAAPALDELTLIAQRASEVFSRLPTRSA
ncbi:hypothetical protein BHS05_14040 [Myxococcus xanthus]|nr:hypothetical protein BHS05_14040 [Myxococcus xanthus]